MQYAKPYNPKPTHLVFASGDCMEFINFIITYLVHSQHLYQFGRCCHCVFVITLSKRLGKHLGSVDTFSIHI